LDSPPEIDEIMTMGPTIRTTAVVALLALSATGAAAQDGTGVDL
jgi:hypothetical protein